MLDIFARVFLFTAVRCGDCSHRFYRPSFFRLLQRRRRAAVNDGLPEDIHEDERASA